MFKKFIYGFLVCLLIFQITVSMEHQGSKRSSPFSFEQEKIKKPKKSKATVIEEKSVITGHDESDIPLYNISYEYAPIDIKVIVEWIKIGLNSGKKSNCIILFGEPGTGKSLLAKTIAYMMAREVLFVDAPSLLGKYRNESLVLIRQLFENLAQKKPMPVLVLDEIDALTHNYDSIHSDKYETAMQLWKKIDEFKLKKDFFLIGTTNKTKDMPVQLQSRFRIDAFKINLPSTELRKKLIQYYLDEIKKTDDVTIDVSCHSDEFLNILANNEKIKKCSSRDIDSLVRLAFRISQRILWPHIDNRIIKSEHLEMALQELEIIDKKTWDFSERLTQEEKSMQLQRELHEDNKYFQRELQKESQDFQSALHQDSMKQQKEFHDESYYQQRDYHNASMDLQQQNHRESMNQQFDLAIRGEQSTRENITRNERYTDQNIDRNERFTEQNISRAERHNLENIERSEEFAVGMKITEIYANSPGDALRDLPILGNTIGAITKLGTARIYRTMLDPIARDQLITGNQQHGTLPTSEPMRLPYTPLNQQNPQRRN